MKKGTKIIIASALVIGTAAAAFFGGYTYVKNRKVQLPEGFTVTAHTGCEGTEDNSLEAIKKGYESGAETVEFDLNFTSDGTPVLAHDHAGDSTVSLEEAFKLIAELKGITVNVDCKATDNLKAVSELAEKYGVKDRIFYTGIEEKDVDAVKAQTPDIAYWLNFQPERKTDREYLVSLAEKVESLGAVGINLNHKYCSEELVEIFHERGLLVSIWTVNNEFDMVRAVELGADNITTRKPSKLNEIVELKTGA